MEHRKPPPRTKEATALAAASVAGAMASEQTGSGSAVASRPGPYLTCNWRLLRMSLEEFQKLMSIAASLDDHALELRCDPTDDLDVLVRGVASLLPQPVHAFHLRSDFLREEEGTRILEPLLVGGTVLLAHSTASPVPGRFVSQWSEYSRHPTSPMLPRIARYQQTTPGLRLTRPGFLVVLHAGGGKVSQRVMVHRLSAEERAELEARGRTAAFPVEHLGVVPPGSSTSLTMKELCLLHTRDSKGTKRRDLPALMALDGGPLTWTDLQTLLRSGSSSFHQFLDVLQKQGRLTDEQWAYGYAAFDYLEERKRSGPRGFFAVYPSIYDVVWELGEWLPAQGYVFRGQADVRWRQDSSLLRGSPDVQTLLERTQLAEAFLTELRARQRQLFGAELSDEELLAVAQHYGFPTPLLDYTRSLQIAAFFATYGARALPPDPERIGVLYYLNFEREELGPGAPAIGLGGFSLLEGARLRVGTLRLIEPRLPDEDNRIGRQQGLFVAGFHPRDLEHVTIDRIYFRQLPGEIFEDPVAGITEAHLLPDASPLARLADEVRKRVTSHGITKVHPLLGATRLPEDSLIGSQGAHLYAQVRSAREFFDALRQFDSSRPGRADLLVQLEKVFSDYFQQSQALALVAELPTDNKKQRALNPLYEAVSRLAELCGTSEHDLWKSVQALREPGSANLHQVLLGEVPVPAADGERIAFACSLFLVSWEHLQHVNGELARSLANLAGMVLYK